jgi:Ca-activated chloride channel family protein
MDNKKVAILIDFNESNTNISVNELLNAIRSEMLVNLSSADSFNLLFSNLSITQYSDNWISGSETNIEEAFNSLVSPLSSYSNLPSLLGSGIEFIKNNGNDGKIILLSNSGQFGDFHVANTLINDIVELMDPKIQIHIADYQSINIDYNYINGHYYLGNEYLYSNLSKITLGSLHRLLNGLSLSGSFREAFKYIGGSIKSFDLYTRVQTGFCHSRYTISGDDNIAYLNDPIIQVGKFKGDFPFAFEISGEYNNEIFSQEIVIQEQNVIIDDTTSEEIWTGLYIKELESGQQSNDIINEIIYTSLNERVLSLYTSFLCVEDSIVLINEGEDEQILIDIQDVVAEKDSISIYPNPFTDNLTIDLICSDPGEVKELSIYNITGAVIYQFNISDLVAGKNTITWNGTTASGDEVKPGMYILVFRTTDTIKTMKIARR